MAIHSKSEFCILAEIKSKDLSVYQKRNKVYVSEDGTVDDNLPVNKDFLQKRKELLNKQKGIKPEPKPQATKEPPSIKPKASVVNRGTRLPPESDPTYNQLLESRELDLQQKRHQTKKTKAEADLKEIQKLKLMGTLIPVDLVKPIIHNITHSILNEVKNYIDERDRLQAKKYRISPEDQAENKGLLVKGLNNSVDKAVDAAMRKVKGIVEEFSETRLQGQHD